MLVSLSFVKEAVKWEQIDDSGFCTLWYPLYVSAWFRGFLISNYQAHLPI